MNAIRLNTRCPVCGALEEQRYKDVDEGTILEEATYCPNGCSEYRYAYGNCEERLGSTEWYWSLNEMTDEFERRHHERLAVIEALKTKFDFLSLLSKGESVSETKQELVTITPDQVGTLPQGGLMQPKQKSAAASAFLQEAKGQQEDVRKIPLIQIDHKLGQFTLPSGEVVNEVAGYPVYYFQTRRFYAKPPRSGEKGSPPDCWSSDLVKPHSTSLEVQSDDCASCAMNQFGTGRDGRSKACGTYTWVFMLNPEFGDVPLGVVVAPPSSLRVLFGTRYSQGYFGQAAARHGHSAIVWTKFQLKVMGDPKSVQYCVLAPVMGPAIEDKAKASQLAHVRNRFLKLMEEFRLFTPDVESGAQTEAAVE